MNIFPAPQRQGDIKFLIAKNLPYPLRVKIILGLFLLGFFVELLFHFWLGLVILACGNILGMIQGFRPKADVTGKQTWNQVTPDEYKKIKEKQKQLAQWDQDLFDGTNPLGGTIFLIVGMLCFFFWFYLGFVDKPILAKYWAWNAGIILLPHWVTGTRDFLKKDRLIIKIDLLEKIRQALNPHSDVQVLPMLSTEETKQGGQVPVDARMMIRLNDAPQAFMGLQVQVSINSVQGTDYPYLYCVLLAKKDAHLFDHNGYKDSVPRNITIEKSTAPDVDVLVIRQKTTKTSGYHTTDKKCAQIVRYALKLARGFSSGF